jgi:hypothetical protein
MVLIMLSTCPQIFRLLLGLSTTQLLRYELYPIRATLSLRSEKSNPCL